MRDLRRLVLLGTCFALLFMATGTEAAIPISTWGTILTQSDTTYVLVNDLLEPSATQGVDDTVALFVLPSVHDVVIDGQGFTIDGRDAAGVPDADIGIRIMGLVTGPVTNLVMHDIRFTDVSTGIHATDDLCRITIENCEFAGCDGPAQISFVTTIPGAAMRWVTIRDSWLHDSRGIPILFANDGNQGSAQQATMAHLYVIANVIHDVGQSLAQPAEWNAAVSIHHGAGDVRLWDNIVLNGEGLSGLFLGSEDIADDVFDQVSIRGNHLGGHTGTMQTPGTVVASGITLDRVTTSTGDFSTWEVSSNYLYLNELAGIDCIVGASSPPSLPTIGNWWGEDSVVSGTYGNGAVNATDSAPRDLADGIVALPDAGGLDRGIADTAGFLAQVLILNQNDGLPGLRGFDVDYDFAPHLMLERGVEGPFLARQAASTQFYDVARIGGIDNERTASGVILGGSSGAIGNGALCLTVFRAGPEELGSADDFVQDAAQLRGPDNSPLTLLATFDADRRIDDTPPEALAFPPNNWPCTSADTALVEVWANDDFALEDVLFRYHLVDCCDALCWQPLALDEPGTAYTGPTLVPIDFSAGEGEYIVEVMATDDAGNMALFQTSVIHDTTPPADFNGVLTAATSEGHGTPDQEEIEISWAGTFELGGDLKLGYLPYGGELGFYAYPEYDDEPGANPHFPVPGEGVVTDLPDINTGSFLFPFPLAMRSFYYFTIFVEDCAANSSPGLAIGNRDSALSYFLGDFDSNDPPACIGSPEYTSGNGDVNFCDMIGFSRAYATIEGNPDYHPAVDIGPIVPGPGPFDGIPLTDNTVNFNDLMIISIMFDSVSAFRRNVVVLEAGWEGNDERGEPVTAETPIRLVLGRGTVAGDRLMLPLLLRGNDTTVKGFEALVEHATEDLHFVSAHPLESDGAEIFFAGLPGAAGLSSISLAVLGCGRVLESSGVVAMLEYRSVDGSPLGRDLPPPRLASTTIRDAWNREVAGQPGGDPTGGSTAGMAQFEAVGRVVNHLAKPVPNPFNPVTTLSFSLTAPGPLTIRIYDAGGRAVRELWNGITPAGSRVVSWDGRTDGGATAPSGLYFAEMHTGQFRSVQKLVLLK